MLRVLLVTDTDKPIGDLRDALASLGCEMLAGTATPQALHRAVQDERPDVIIIDTESPSRDTLEQLAVMVQKQTEIVRDKYHVHTVAFRVETVDGKVKLKAKPLQD